MCLSLLLFRRQRTEGSLRFGNFSPDSYVSTISVTNEDYNVPSLSLSVPVSGVSVPVENISVPEETASVPPQDFSVPEGDSNPNLPKDVDRLILSIGRRSNDAQKVDSVILVLCSFRPLSVNELSKLLHRTENYLKSKFIKRLLAEQKLYYTIPEMKNHPNQKYTTKPDGM